MVATNCKLQTISFFKQSKNVHQVATESGLEALMSHLQLEGQDEADKLDVVILLANEKYLMKSKYVI